VTEPARGASDPGATTDAGAFLTNARVASILEEMADLLELKGESSFKVGAYRRAAESVARSPIDVIAAYRAGQPPRLRGVGDSIAASIGELAEHGAIRYHARLSAELPPTLLAMRTIPGMGPRTIGEVWRQLGIATLSELEQAAREGRLRQLRGLSARTEARILEGIARAADRPLRRLLMGDANWLSARVVGLLAQLPDARSAMAAGSVRRRRETVGDLDVLVETDRPAAVLAALEALPGISVVTPGTGLRGGHDRVTVELQDGPHIDVMTMPPGKVGSYLVHFTGSAEHNVQLRHRARQQGWSLSEHGLSPLPAADAPEADAAVGTTGSDAPSPGTDAASAGLRTFESEGALYAALGLAEIPPELREGRGEIEAAATGRLPDLVRLEDLRGDCHSHSDWSDGREPLLVMVESARAAGRDYQVLTDHTRSLAIANGLTPERVEEQRRVIGELNERFAREHAAGELPSGAHPGGFRLLHGCELEITLDGRLDYDDALLSTFDVVVASLHVGRRQPRRQLMVRYEVAMRSPHVDIISHPSGRKIGRRPDLDLDWEAFYRMAAESGTILEVNGSEERLDLDEHRIRAAHDAGCRFVVDSDAHDRGEWQNLVWGIDIARRGWLEAGDVVNTLDLDGFLAALRR
jgi:DNA polymerase (family 10)